MSAFWFGLFVAGVTWIIIDIVNDLIGNAVAREIHARGLDEAPPREPREWY